MFVKYNNFRENTLSWKRYYPVDEFGPPANYKIIVEYPDGKNLEFSYRTREVRDRMLNQIDQLANMPTGMADITP